MVRVRAPELPKTLPWLNSHPLSLAGLRGRVVLLDFWSYCCINCLHVLPDLNYLERKYRDRLAVIGVHSAKFDSEKETESIGQAVLRYDIQHPVLVDSKFQVWDAYAVRAYPTFVVIDPEGYVVFTTSGEGKRETLDQLIGSLIQSAPGNVGSSAIALMLEKDRTSIVSPLAFPGKVLVDQSDEDSNHLFVADSGHHRIVIGTPKGDVLAIAGTGEPGLADGHFTEAQFCNPQGMAWDRVRQFLYVADTNNHAIRRLDLTNQIVTTIAGTGSQSRILYPHGGKALETPLNSPWDLALVDDQLFVAIAGSHQIWQMPLQQGVMMTYAGTGAEGCVDGSAEIAAFAQPSGLATDGDRLFIADSETSSIRSIRLDTAEVQILCGSGDLYGFGDVDGVGEHVRLQHCLDVADGKNILWIADTYNHKIKTVSRLSGVCQTVFGDGKAGWRDGIGQATQFFEPSGVSTTRSHLYVADTNNHVIRYVNLETLRVRTVEFRGLCAPDVCSPLSL